MCKWGTNETVRVRIDASLSHSGEAYWKDVHIDACIAPLVRALQGAGIDMLASCCGHGKGNGRIDLADGRVLFISEPPEQRFEVRLFCTNCNFALAENERCHCGAGGVRSKVRWLPVVQVSA